MGKIATITVQGELAEFMEHKVSSGDYASESEVVQAALELLRDQDGLLAIRAAIEEGEASGEPQPFDSAAFLDEMHRKYGA
jgi:antitoxin ParD1/3/4